MDQVPSQCAERFHRTEGTVVDLQARELQLVQGDDRRINGEVVGFLAKAGLPSAQPQVQQAQEPRAPQQRMETSRTEVPQFAGAGGLRRATSTTHCRSRDNAARSDATSPATPHCPRARREGTRA